jgi:sarcosine oxidase
MKRHDVIVIGLGVVGGATALALARSGATVLGLDQFDPPHRRGSSHGDTRITRLAVGEGAAYAPLVARSHDLWRQLESEAGREILRTCGGLVMGVPGATGQHHVDDFTAQTIEVARGSGVDHEILDVDEIRRRFPPFAVTTETGCFEPSAGYVRAEVAVAAQLERARQLGADLRTGETVLAWSSDGSGVRVASTAGEHFADRLVIAVGPWVGQLVHDLRRHFAVHRQVLYWFDIERNAESFASLPIFIWMYGTVPGQFVYGFPAIDGPHGGVKLAHEDFSAETGPDVVSREVTAEETAAMYEQSVRPLFPDLSPRCLRSEVCLYTVTSDFGFVVDHLDSDERVVVASPCSGHGFKHAPAVGEGAAALALGTRPRVDLAPFALGRLRDL